MMAVLLRLHLNRSRPAISLAKSLFTQNISLVNVKVNLASAMKYISGEARMEHEQKMKAMDLLVGSNSWNLMLSSSDVRRIPGEV